MKVLVTGGRGYSDRDKVFETLDRIDGVYYAGVSLIITGGARGADSLASHWARTKGIPLCVFPANWDYYGKGAGPVRNGHMLDFAKPDLVVMFPGGAGTKNMAAQAISRGVPVEGVS